MDDIPKVQRANQVVGSLIDFGRNFPPPSPIVELAIADSFAHLQKTDIASAIRFPRFTGTEKDRRAGAAWLSRRLGQEPEADRIVLANGSQSILTMLMARYIKPGGVLLTEALTYPAIKSLSALFDIRLHGVAIDDKGIMPDSLDEECRRLHGNAGALYCMPTLHNPTSATMSDGRRQDIAKIARQHDLAIFEDDIYGVLPTDAPPPLATYAPERSWYFVGLSKALASQLRVAYVLAPSKALAEDAFWPGVRTTNWMVAPLIAEIASHWLSNTIAGEILQSVRVETQTRRSIAESALGMIFNIDPSSYHLWIKLPSRVRLADFFDAAKQRGVVVGAGKSFAVDCSHGDARFRVGLGVPGSHHELRKGLTIISELIKAKP